MQNEKQTNVFNVHASGYSVSGGCATVFSLQCDWKRPHLESAIPNLNILRYPYYYTNYIRSGLRLFEPGKYDIRHVCLGEGAWYTLQGLGYFT